jgi:hypothetical protein
VADETNETPPAHAPANFAVSPTRPLVERAIERLSKGERLPAPKTWDEYWAGATVWVALKWPREGDEVGFKCHKCGGEKAELGQVVGLAANERWPAPPAVGYASFPCIQYGCSNCGDLHLIDALKIFEAQEPLRPS